MPKKIKNMQRKSVTKAHPFTQEAAALVARRTAEQVSKELSSKFMQEQSSLQNEALQLEYENGLIRESLTLLSMMAFSEESTIEHVRDFINEIKRIHPDLIDE